ncbi:AB-hydrolase lipase domain [Dillenia turbinata]|uniref:AB-hydrolase lipase domain n=1 Tax=Dillenia turbinata TaxID=194707 RepID=A0AAN8UUB3_9MAGN
MSKTFSTLAFLFLLCRCSAFRARTKLFSTNGNNDAEDGISKLTVTTQDGNLSMQRIPQGRAGGNKGDKPPVLLQHGLLMDGITWLLNPPEQSLALLLADNYDVWLANARGTKFSRGHTSLKREDPAFWDWSWDELVAHDFPATFQYVHDQTGQKSHYVGHSLGNLIAVAAFSQEQLLSMLRSVVMLCPTAHMGNITSPLARNAAEKFIAEALYWLGIDEFDPKGEAADKLLQEVCKLPGVDCTQLLNSFTVLLFLFTASAEGRAKFGSSLDANDGICATMVQTQGYLCHEHDVTTEDGYRLSMQRMPMSRSGKAANQPPVLLQHGLMVDGITWLMNSPDESLAFILADNGYDVWIANARGTKYSRGHISLSPSDAAYWNWTWDELVAYDLSATVQYVQNQTGQKLHYVGHSLGTLMALASFSQHNLLNMLRSAALLSPIAYLSQLPSPLVRAAADAFLAEVINTHHNFSSFYQELRLSIFALNRDAAAKLLAKICAMPGMNCFDLVTAITGKNCCLNSSNLDALLNHEPQPTATKNLIHLAQMVRQGTIAMYDYGNANDNMEHYGEPTPPLYNMASIPEDFPLFLSYGGQDTLSDVNDVKVLLDNLKDHQPDKLIVQYIEDYAHADFVFGVNAYQVVYNPLMSFFKLQ